MNKFHFQRAQIGILLMCLVLSPVGIGRTLAQGQAQRDRRAGVDASQVAAANAPRTVAELQASINEVLRRPELAPGFLAVKVASLETGRILFEASADKLMRPASNMKLYTVAAALDRLTPDYRFTTSVYAAEKPEKNGTIKGDLIVYGRGDPSIAARFNDGDYFKGINNLVDRIVAAGVKRIKGDLVGDESYLTGPALGSGWEWEDLQWWYGAEVSALTINDNSLDLTVKPGAKVGAPCVVTTGPPAPFVTIVNRATTSAAGSKSALEVFRGPGENVLELTGTLPLDDKGYTGGVAVPDPALFFVSMLREALAKRGIKVDGRSRTVDGRSTPSLVPARGAMDLVSGIDRAIPPPVVEITNLQSPPLSVIASQTLKPSQNLYTELLLRTLGKAAPASPKTDEQAGLEVVRGFLRQSGIHPDDIVLNDGSGLSRNDMVTASSSLQLLIYMSRHRYADVFRDALPIAGVDGTLRSRMKGTAAAGNVRAKTGSLSSVASLSGYVTSAAGERLAFSMMLNNYPDASAVRKDSIDAIAVLLASFAGRSQ
ncbi:MAG: hypothetical protein QOD75_3611 [Blastocatellia bacterium]|jgi:D-alanyl-D-alanine carboxypeptidase/D-alanyl-D-alanine-endopeptidase (penicillin-binding protein 4)|nr:hypothetical protein [Blastocatellia bacterium]